MFRISFYFYIFIFILILVKNVDVMQPFQFLDVFVCRGVLGMVILI